MAVSFKKSSYDGGTCTHTPLSTPTVTHSKHVEYVIFLAIGYYVVMPKSLERCSLARQNLTSQ